jgi:hypothetical protein
MKVLLFIPLLLTGCATHPGPSVQPIRSDIANAKSASTQTTKHVQAISKGLDKVDYKATRARGFFN